MTTHGIRRDVFWSYGAQTIQAFLSFGLSVFLARVDRSGTLLGSYALAVGIGAPIFVFWSLQLKVIIATDAKGEYSFGEYFGARLLCIGAALVCLVSYFALFVRDPLVGGMLVSISVWRATDLLGDIFQGYLQRNGAVVRMSQSSIARSVTTSIAIAAGLVIGFSTAIVFLFAAGASLLVLVFVELTFSREIRRALPTNHFARDSFRPSFSPHALRTLFVRALPTGFTAVLGSVHGQLPLYLMGAFHGTAALGKFSAVYSPIVASQIFMAAPIDGVLARLAQAIATRDILNLRSLFTRLIQIASLLSFLVIMGGLTVGPFFVSLVFGGTYGGGPWVLRLLCLGLAANFFATTLSGLMMSSRAYVLILMLSVGGFTLSLAANWSLIPLFAGVGAAGAFAITAFLSVCIQIWPAYRVWQRTANLAT